MKIAKIRNVKTPQRGTNKSAGIDFFVPNDWDILKLMPGESALIPSGIKVEVPPGHMLIAHNKSGICTKRNLIIGACVVDEDYQGEIHLHLINVGPVIAAIDPGDKIAQFILVPITYSDIEEVLAEDLHLEVSTRGAGGFGSTGSK